MQGSFKGPTCGNHVPVGSKSRTTFRFAFRTLRYGRRVDVQRRADVHMAKKFLLHLDVRAVLIQETRIGVPERVPAESLDSHFSPRTPQPTTCCCPWMRRSPCAATGEDPGAFLYGERTRPPMLTLYFLQREISPSARYLRPKKLTLKVEDTARVPARLAVRWPSIGSNTG